MSAAISLAPSLRTILDQDQIERENPMQCRFCQCDEFTPCAIPVAADEDGTVRLARADDEVVDVLPCGWYFDRVCNAPRCIEKLIAEWRGEETGPRVLLFDSTGRRLPSSREMQLDLDADHRDFQIIGRELGILPPEETTREAILTRIRELRRMIA